MNKTKIINATYLHLFRKEQKAYERFKGVMGSDSTSRRARDHEYSNYLAKKAKRLEYRANNKKIVRKELFEEKLVLN
ncbi:MAG: hypothetical protein MRY57_03140 [Candidatus Pacebacteria bacterium]|nr:hypothetical protein [Candidatus Paceibacterota bacterium]